MYAERQSSLKRLRFPIFNLAQLRCFAQSQVKSLSESQQDCPWGGTAHHKAYIFTKDNIETLKIIHVPGGGIRSRYSNVRTGLKPLLFTVSLSYKKINSYETYAHSFYEHWSAVCCMCIYIYKPTYVCLFA